MMKITNMNQVNSFRFVYNVEIHIFRLIFSWQSTSTFNQWKLLSFTRQFRWWSSRRTIKS